MFNQHQKRIVVVLNKNKLNIDNEYVLYIVKSSFFLDYNYTLESALHYAKEVNKPLYIIYYLDPNQAYINTRTLKFIEEGVTDFQAQLDTLSLEMHVISDINKVYNIINKAIIVYSDYQYYHPFKYKEDTQVILYDNNVVVPINKTYPKAAYNAYGIRNHLLPLINEYHHKTKVNYKVKSYPFIQENNLFINLFSQAKVLNHSIQIGGNSNAFSILKQFIEYDVEHYQTNKKINLFNGTSRLSSYLHHGHISPLSIYDAVMLFDEKAGSQSFIEQFIVRRELAYNYVFYHQDNYLVFENLPNWALKTMDEHQNDIREYLYNLEEFENSLTHDHAWNAMQKQLVTEGYIPNYLRMYWGKKIIEWSYDYHTAFKIMIYLNDMYQLDGQDANGIVGILWCFGLHDRAWQEREVFGKLRYMNYQGLLNKTNIKEYEGYYQ